MIKSNTSTEFEDGSVHILSVSTSKTLEKVAACSEITNFLLTLRPIPGRSYLHINMLGASDIYSATRNGDYFSSDTLKKYHHTFQTTPAKFFKGHRNTSTSPHFGVCVFATYNESMHRIELIIEADEATSKEIDEQISKGFYPKTSMACKLPYDVCSICGNKARTREQYCVHLSTMMNKIFPDGRKVVAINDTDIKWFDCSLVFRPADITSSVLQKVADDSNIAHLGSAERAELEGYTEKKASIKKWSELIKEISDSGQVLSDVTGILSKVKDLPLTLISVLRNYDLNQVLTAMAVLGITPSIKFLSELIASIHLGEGYEGIGELVEEYVKNVNPESMAPVVPIESPLEPINPILLSLLLPYYEGSSLLSPAIEKRASGVGYSNNGPYVEPTIEEELAAKRLIEPAKQFELSYGKLLLGLGASALLAKYFISSEIEKRLREDRNVHIPQNYAKIGLMKKASYQAASSLSKATMLPYVEDKQREDLGINGLGMARKFLKSTKTATGTKLSRILKAVGLVQKTTDALTQTQ